MQKVCNYSIYFIFPFSSSWTLYGYMTRKIYAENMKKMELTPSNKYLSKKHIPMIFAAV